MSPTAFRSACVLAALAAGAPSFSAEMDYTAELGQIASRVDETEARMAEVREDIIERRGFIGAAEASARYENAVYYNLVGEYDRAAKEFFTLVESRSLKDPFMRQEAEWYLAESLFELGNTVLAEEVFQGVIDQGSGHAFFGDSVRRLMELYSITGDAEGFYTLYNQYITSGRVAPTPAVQYSLAKSFYRQAEYDRARELLGAIPEDSSYFGKARYLLGTIEVVGGDYEAAIEHFDRAANISISGPDEKEVADLAALALGRLYQELDDFVSSALYYQRIGRDSKYFADALYEISWTFIKDSDYDQALQSVEIFLLAFPEHRYAPQLKLLQGKLHMKEIQYESALSSFETVIETYSGLQGTLAEMGGSTQAAASWLDQLVELDVSPTEFDDATGISTYEREAEQLRTPGGEVLPAFAVEMLVSQEDMSRAFGVSRELSRQSRELEESQELIEQLELALQESGDTLGVFQKARLQLDRYEGESFLMLGELLRIEEAWLLNHAQGEVQTDLQGMQRQREDLERVLSELRTTELNHEDRVKRYDAQVREVQQRAANLSESLAELEDQYAELAEMLDSGEHELSSYDEEQARAQLAQIEVDIESSREELERLQSEQARLGVTAPIRRRPDSGKRSSELGALREELSGLKRRYDGYWGKVDSGGEAAAIRGELSALWERVDAVQDSVASVRSQMESGERAEVASVRSRLAAETGSVDAAQRDLLRETVANDRLSSEVAQIGFQRLADEFAQTLLQADVGIVDVYWLRKVAVTDDREGVQREREALLRELNDRFRIIRQGLED